MILARASVISSFDREVTGKRTFDDNAEGNAHYGLKADWVEEVRLEAIADAKKSNAANPGQPQVDPDQEARDALGTLYNSAEAYLQMWERTENR